MWGVQRNTNSSLSPLNLQGEGEENGVSVVFGWSKAGIAEIVRQLFLQSLGWWKQAFLELTLSVCCLFWLGGFYTTSSDVCRRQTENSGSHTVPRCSSSSEGPNLSGFFCLPFRVFLYLIVELYPGILVVRVRLRRNEATPAWWN